MAKTTIGDVKIIHGALDETPLRGGTVILRGVIDPTSLPNLQTDDYQRESAPVTPRSSIWQALVNSQVLPDVELGIRSERFSSSGNTFTLQDPTYIIDGLQRVSTAIQFLTKNAGAPVRIGCLVHFDTTKEWERERFRILNSSRSKVSPNVLLRNERDNSVAADLLFNLTENDRDFVLHNRVTWTQKMARQEIITALNMSKIVATLHTHKVRVYHTSLYPLIGELNKQVDVVGTQILRQNVRTFFDIVDKCWGIRMVTYHGATHMRFTFLRTLARIFSDHYDFWVEPNEKRLTVSADIIRKLKGFQPTDPSVAALVGSSGKAHWMLYAMIRDHINSGKRTKRLRSRIPDNAIELEMDQVEDVASGESE